MAEDIEKKLGDPPSPDDELPIAVHHGNSRVESSRLEQLRRYFYEEVSTDHADLLMLACCLISGFVDSTLYNGMLVTRLATRTAKLTTT